MSAEKAAGTPNVPTPALERKLKKAVDQTVGKATNAAVDGIKDAKKNMDDAPDHHHMRTLILPVIRQEGETVPVPQWDEALIAVVTFPYKSIKKTIHKACKMDPLPKDFDYSYSLVAYGHRTLTLLCYTIGLRLGTTYPAVWFFSNIFYEPILALLAYVLVPMLGIVAHRRCTLAQIPIEDRRLLLCLHAFFSGLSVAYLLRHFISNSSAPPVYMLPAMVGVTVMTIGPQYAYDRPSFLIATIGSAAVVDIMISAAMAPLTIEALLAIAAQCFNAVLYVQAMVYDVAHGDKDIIEGNLVGMLYSMVTYSIYKMIVCKYDPERNDDNLPSLIGVFS